MDSLWNAYLTWREHAVNTQDWFDDEVTETIKLNEKHLKHSNPTKLHIDEELYKESKYVAIRLIKEKKMLQRKI